MGACGAFQVARAEVRGGMLCVRACRRAPPAVCMPRGLAYARLGLAKASPPTSPRGGSAPYPGETARWRAPAARSSVARTPVR